MNVYGRNSFCEQIDAQGKKSNDKKKDPARPEDLAEPFFEQRFLKAFVRFFQALFFIALPGKGQFQGE